MTDFKKECAAVNSIEVVPVILDTICRSTGMGFAAIACVTQDRWTLCAVRDDIGLGLKPGDELDGIHRQESVIIENAADDKRHGSYPMLARYGLGSYISTPIILKDGTFFGMLCAMDSKPARIGTPQILTLFAELVAFHLGAIEQQAGLEQEQKSVALRDQFIAVLNHDLRNPLGAILGSMSLLGRMTPLNDKGTAIVEMARSSAMRMNELIINVMDFAHLRMGSGISLHREPVLLGPVLEHAVQDLRAIKPGRVIETEFVLDKEIKCDQTRIAQLLSCLVGNALKHGAAQAAVHVRAFVNNDVLELSVSNTGKPIPPNMLAKLFEPLTSEEVSSARKLRLGLYVAAEIAKAHGGVLSAASSPEETRFTFRMPV